MRIGVHAGNLLSGGAITHLRELLSAAEPQASGVEQVLVWGGSKIIDCLPARSWLQAEFVPALDSGLTFRTLWETTRLGRLASQECDLLFVPGGTYLGTFRPFVAMSRTLLPFDGSALRRYRGSSRTFKYGVLRRAQVATFRRADGVIFLSSCGRNLVLRHTGALLTPNRCVPHGVSEGFRQSPRSQRSLDACTSERPFVLLYVSSLQRYKHQDRLIETVAELRKEHGLPLRLVLVGGTSDQRARHDFEDCLARLDPNREFVDHREDQPYELLPELYSEADLFVFPSSCENMPNVLLEAMASSLPIVSSITPPMPEILGPAARYFDLEVSDSLEQVLRDVLPDREQRRRLAEVSFYRSQNFSWERTARETFDFLREVFSGVG